MEIKTEEEYQSGLKQIEAYMEAGADDLMLEPSTAEMDELAKALQDYERKQEPLPTENPFGNLDRETCLDLYFALQAEMLDGLNFRMSLGQVEAADIEALKRIIAKAMEMRQ